MSREALSYAVIEESGWRPGAFGLEEVDRNMMSWLVYSEHMLVYHESIEANLLLSEVCWMSASLRPWGRISLHRPRTGFASYLLFAAPLTRRDRPRLLYRRILQRQHCQSSFPSPSLLCGSSGSGSGGDGLVTVISVAARQEVVISKACSHFPF